MRQAMMAVATLFLLAGTSLAQKGKEEEKCRFVPPEVVSTSDALSPPNSVAWGTVILEVSLNEAGAQEAVKLLRDIPSLSEPARDALKKWSFKPGTLDGKPVPAKITVAFTFNSPLLIQSRSR